jgi:hypothetical protein
MNLINAIPNIKVKSQKTCAESVTLFDDGKLEVKKDDIQQAEIIAREYSITESDDSLIHIKIFRHRKQRIY